MDLKCFHCNGYYGPSFGQPVCSVCHSFLYPDDAELHSSSFHFSETKVEDGDSGNEEPREPPDCPGQSLSGVSPDDAAPVDGSSRSEDSRRAETPEEYPEGLALYPSEGDRPETASPASWGLADAVEDRFNRKPDVNVAQSLVQESFNSAGLTENTENSTVSICSFPAEVMLVVFQLLDEMSLWSVGQVCRRWQALVTNCNFEWRVFVQRRWPLFSPIYNVSDWHKVFTNLIESAPCQLCLFRTPITGAAQAHADSWRLKRLRNERRTLHSDPPEGISASPFDSMSLHWQASIRGPAGSPYQGGTFFLYIQFPSNYPICPPLVRFVTRIFHPNVSRHGDIGIDSIQHNWSVAITISKVLVSIQSLLTDPYTKVCMEPRIGQMYDENRAKFERIARAWTWCHAMHDAIDPVSLVPGYMNRLTSDAFLKTQQGMGEKLSEDSSSSERETIQSLTEVQS